MANLSQLECQNLINCNYLPRKNFHKSQLSLKICHKGQSSKNGVFWMINGCQSLVRFEEEIFHKNWGKILRASKFKQLECYLILGHLPLYLLMLDFINGCFYMSATIAMIYKTLSYWSPFSCYSWYESVMQSENLGRETFKMEEMITLRRLKKFLRSKG